MEATNELGEPAHAGVPATASVWYRWNSGKGGRVHVVTCNSDFDTVLAAYTGSSVAALTEVASDNDSCGANAMLYFATVPNTDYWIAVDGVGAATGTIEFEWWQEPHNDARADAEAIAGETGVLTVSNLFGTFEADEPQPAGPGGRSVWYRWTAPSSGPARFDTCASGHDTLLAVYEGASMTALSADDDACEEAGGSIVRFTAEAGKAYLLSVDGYDGSQFEDALLNWNRETLPPAAPENLERPVILGNAQEGETLLARDGTWVGAAPLNFTYEWARCNVTALFCQMVPGANAPTYPLTAADVSFRMRVFVTATNSLGSQTMNSAATAPVISRPSLAPRNTALPTITGMPAENQTLTAAAGNWEAYPAPLFTYQWQSCDQAGTACEDIAAENEPTLVLSPMEVGRRIRVVVLARNNAGAATASSELTTAVRGTSSRRPRRCVVPNVHGKTLAAARKAIRRGRCRVGRVTRSWSARVAAGKVIRQRPAPRTRLAAQGRVHLVVSKGRRR